jgi:hypothetical protein
MLRTVAAILFIALSAGTAWSSSLSLNFNDDSAQFEYLHLLSREAYGESNARLRLLFEDDTDTFLGSAGAGVKGSPGNLPGLETEVMVSAFSSKIEGEKLLSIGVGLGVDYAPPSLGGLGVTAGIHYGPKVFTFLDAEDYLETTVGLRYFMMTNAALTLAYQNILVDFDAYGDVRLDDSVRIGVRIDF